MKFVSITQRLIFWFVLLLILPLLLFGYMLLHTFEKELKQTVITQISNIADKKIDQINNYLDERSQDVIVKLQGDAIRSATREFSRELVRGGFTSIAYQKLDVKYRDYFKRYILSSGYYDVFLISTQGTVVYSYQHEADFSTNLFTGPYRDSGLSRVVRNTMSTLESSVSEFDLYAPSANAVAAFIAAPLVNQGRIEGVLAVQLNNAHMYKVLLDRTGLGVSGETVVARMEEDNNALVMAPLLSDPDAAFKYRIKLNEYNHDIPQAYALNGQRGSGFEIDYRGREVAAAWRYLPNMKLGMVVKMDNDEALAALYRVRNFTLLVFVLALFIAVIAAIMIGRSVVLPLRRLNVSAQNIAEGKFDQRLPLAVKDELGQLAGTFNRMAEQLQESYGILEQKVEKRTAELTDTMQKLKEAQNLAQMGSWELNLLSGKLTWSDEIYRLLEIDQNQFCATNEAFLKAIHPDDRNQISLAYSESLKEQKPYDLTYRLLMSDGRIKWMEERCESDFGEDGAPLLSRGTLQDITIQKMAEDALRESETRYHSVVASLFEGVVLTSKDGVITTANDAAQKILGLSLAQLMGHRPVDSRWYTIHEDGKPFPLDTQPGNVTLRTGEHQSNVIMGVRKPDGSLTWISINSQPVYQPGTSLLSFVVTSFFDITERKNAEFLLKKNNEELERRVELRTSLLRKAKEEAEKANHSKSLFLTSMSHELRTPLNAILGYSQLMEMDASLPEIVVENAAEIRRAGDYLLHLVNDILDLSRIESGDLQLKIEPVALSEVLKICHAQNIQAAISRNITLHIDESCAECQVNADKRGLMQVLNNFVSNAVKYNREWGRVKVSCTEKVSGMVKISVMDTGLGIAPEKQTQLFQPFNRLGAEMSNIEGTGIGLVISQKLVEGMQGVIGVESVNGLGSTFWVELPTVKYVKMRKPESFASIDQSVAITRRVPNVLVVEDYGPNQKVLLLQLQTMGCNVDIASDGSAALTMWRKKPYDLILTDIDMPIMDGVELVQALRKEERIHGGHIPVVAITATSIASERQRYQLAGIDEVLGKPLTMDMLRYGLMRWLGNMPVSELQIKSGEIEQPAGMEGSFSPLDLNYLYKILGQVNLDQARILIDTFLKTAHEGLVALGPQMENAAVVEKEMHKQKSSAKTVGALRYANLASVLEQQARNEQLIDVASSLKELKQALSEVETAAARLLEMTQPHMVESANTGSTPVVALNSALVVDDDMVVLHQVKAMLHTLGVGEVLTAINGVEATQLLATRGGEIELLVCDLSMPEMDGVELIRGFGKTGFKGSLILISGADEKIINTVNKLAVLQGVRVLGQIQKPVSAEQLTLLLAHSADLPAKQLQAANGTVVTREALSAAMANNEFCVWFQPKVEATSLRVVGTEALARWQMPSGKFIPPDSFITVAEREGVIGELSKLLVSLALSEAAKLFASGFPLKVAINLSGSWLNDLSLPDFIFAKTRSSGLRAEDVILEVTETGVMEDLTTALDVLSRLRLKGFGLSIDDFGIGYSSFEQLGRIPFTEMKLDRSFVSKGVVDSAARAILESSMDMAHKLNLSTVAEGVETDLDLKLMRSLGCDLVQGYFIAKPMPVKDLLVWLENETGKNII